MSVFVSACVCSRMSSSPSAPVDSEWSFLPVYADSGKQNPWCELLAVLTKYFHLKKKEKRKKTHTPKLCFLLLHSISIEVLQWSHQSSWQIWSLKSELYILQLFVMLNDITDVILLPASTRMFQILLQCFPVSSFLLSLNSFYFVVMIVEWVGR